MWTKSSFHPCILLLVLTLMVTQSTVMILLFKFERALYAFGYCYKHVLHKASQLWIMHYVHKHKICMQAPHTQSSLVIAPPPQKKKKILLFVYSVTQSYQLATRLDQEFKMNSTNQLTHNNIKGLLNTQRHCQHFARGGSRKQAPLTV